MLRLGSRILLSIVCTVLLLNSYGSSCLSFVDFIFFEIMPKFLKLSSVLFKIIRVVNNQNVLLIAATRLEGPVEGSCEHKLIVTDHKLIMHVEARFAVSSNRNARLSESLNIGAFIASTLIVADHSYMNSSFVTFNHSIRKIIICDIEHADDEILLGHVDVLHDLANILLVREEESVHESRFGSVQILFSNCNQFS